MNDSRGTSGGPRAIAAWTFRATAALLMAGLAGCATYPAPGAAPARPAPVPASTSTPGQRLPSATAGERSEVAGSDEVPVPMATPSVADSGRVVGNTASGGRIVARNVPAVVDSGPSSEARAVLSTIPDPIPAGEQVPPPARVARLYPPVDMTPGRAGADSMGGGTWVSDTSAAGEGMASDSAGVVRDANGVPVPEPTLPLGQRRTVVPILPDSVLRAAADSVLRAGPPAAGATTGPAALPAAPSSATPDSCWRVQVAAPEEPDRAERLRSAAESLLLIPMVVEREKGLYKVRTRDCLSAAAAQTLKTRASETGFDGAFRFLKQP
jgi:SPOR domain